MGLTSEKNDTEDGQEIKHEYDVGCGFLLVVVALCITAYEIVKLVLK